MSASKSYVRIDEHGVMRVGGTRVMLEGIVYSFRHGHSPESIRSQYPSLTLEDVYGAIAYCLANPAEIEEYLARQEQVWNEFRDECERNPSPVMERLRAIKRARMEVS